MNIVSDQYSNKILKHSVRVPVLLKSDPLNWWGGETKSDRGGVSLGGSGVVRCGDEASIMVALLKTNHHVGQSLLGGAEAQTATVKWYPRKPTVMHHVLTGVVKPQTRGNPPCKANMKGGGKHRKGQSTPGRKINATVVGMPLWNRVQVT